MIDDEHILPGRKMDIMEMSKESYFKQLREKDSMIDDLETMPPIISPLEK